MRKHRTRAWTWVLLLVAGGTCGYAGGANPPGEKTPNEVFRDEPQARALYDQMLAALQKPQTLSYQSEYRWESQGQELGRGTYRIWLKKPNQIRMEGVRAGRSKGATMVGDGENLWLFWSGDRPRFGPESDEMYHKTRSNVYLKKPAPPGGYSIGDETNYLGVGLWRPVLDPSVFHGHTNSRPPVAGVMGRGMEKVAEEQCDVVEARSSGAGFEVVTDATGEAMRKRGLQQPMEAWWFWLSRKDHPPRKLKHVRVTDKTTTEEAWSNIVTDGPLSAEKFTWTPPTGWQLWEEPKPEDMLLKPGTPAPDFELSLADGIKGKRSDYRDKIVWLHTWKSQAGSMARGAQIRDLQRLYEKYRDKGLVILGFNCWEDDNAAREFFRRNGATFPTVLDASGAAYSVYYTGYRGTGLMLSYIIDRQGNVVDAFIDEPKRGTPTHDEGCARALAALKKAGLEIEGQ